jgi:hypothetical protein
MPRNEVIPNQVFIGLPWKHVKGRYERVITELTRKSPLSFVIVGRGDGQDAEDLLQVIKNRLEASSHAIFDATWGNANVSLEYGYAEAKNIPRALYYSTHKAAKKATDSAIISDLAGKRRNSYATEPTLRSLLSTFSTAHPYTKRFEKFLTQEGRRLTRGEKKSFRTLALKAIHQLDGQPDVRREDMIQALRGIGYKQTEVEDVLRKLHKRGLIYVEPGRYSSVSVA